MNLRQFFSTANAIVIALTLVVIFNTCMNLFKTPGALGWILTGLSYMFLPAHIGAIIMTNAYDPPDVWGVMLCYSIQGLMLIGITMKVLPVSDRDDEG